jgi:hypothetical protein
VTINNHKYPPLPEPSSNMEMPLIRDVRKARAIGRKAMKRPMRMRGTLFIEKEYRQARLRLIVLGVLPKHARVLGGLFNLYILYYFNERG